MTHADTPTYHRLMRLADQVLTALETAPRPTNAVEIARVARAILAAERMLRAIYTPLVKAKKTSSSPAMAGSEKNTSSPAKAGEVAASEAKVTEGAKPSEMPPPSRLYRADPPPPLRPDGLTREDERASAEAPNADWQKGWADKQAQMREQRAARTGKWPDGTAYKKPTKKTG